MPRSLLLAAFAAALAGFLFGFDTVVISGADLPLQELWNRGDAFHGFVVMGAALWGTVLGALFGGLPTDRLGRKPTLVLIGVLYLVSAVGSALAADPYAFAAMRLLGGLGVGASTIAAPAYISEIAPAEHRGKLVAMYQANIVLGILLAYVSNYLLGDYGESPWRYMLGVEALPALVYAGLALTLPRSPAWLADRGRSRGPSTRASLWSARYRRPVVLAILVAAFNQFSGINAFLYYAPRIFEAAGLETRTALLSGIGIGLTNLAFTLLGLSLIDRLGRRTLMYVGTVGYVVSLTLVALAFALGWQGVPVPAFLFLFIAAHAVGQGTVIWVFIAEIFPTEVRASGQALGSSVHWLLAASIPSAIPLLFGSVGPAAVFGFFAAMMVAQGIFVWRMMPETRGIPLGEVSASMGPA